MVLEDGPALRRYAFRTAVALPFFLLPLAAVALWYLLGCAIWAELHNGQFGLGSNAVNLGAAVYGIVGVVLVAIAYGSVDNFLGAAWWYGALVGIPWGLLGLVNLLFVVLQLFADLLGGVPEWSGLWEALIPVATAVLPSVTFLVTGWLARKGWDVRTGHTDLEDAVSPAGD